MDRHKHRIIEQFRLERMSEVSCPTSCSNQGHQWGLIRLLRALSSLVLKTSKDRDHTTSLDYLLPCMIVLVGQKIFFTSSLNFSFQHMPVVSHSLPHTTVMSLAPLPWRPPCKYWKVPVRSPQSLPFHRLSKPHSLTLSSQSLASSLNHFGGLCRTHSSSLVSFLYQVGPKLDILL